MTGPTGDHLYRVLRDAGLGHHEALTFASADLGLFAPPAAPVVPVPALPAQSPDGVAWHIRVTNTGELFAAVPA